MKNRLVIALLCLLTLPAALTSEVSSEAAYNLVVARLLADEGRGREASESFIAAIELAPEDPYIRLEYGKFLVRQRRLLKAAQQVTNAYQLAPHEPDVLRVYAETQLKLVDQDPNALGAAREALEELRSLGTDDVESMVSLGQIYLSEQSPAEAAEVFQEVLDRTSGNRMVVRLLVDALMRAGQTERAEETLQQALDLDPLFTRARVILSEILSQQGRTEESVQVLAAAPDAVQGDPELQKRLALELHRVGDHAGALTAIDRVLEDEPSDYAAMYLKAVILSLQGETEAATQLANRLVALHPDSLDVVVLLAELLERQGRWQEADEALQRIEKQLRLDRDTQAANEVLSHRAVVLSHAAAWSELVEALEAHLPELEDVEAVELIFLYAEAQARLGQAGKALAILSRFDSQTPAGRAAIAKQAEILYRQQDDRGAAQHIEDLLATETFDDMVRAAEVYQRLERYDEANPILEMALDIEPDSTQAMFWLSASYERSGRGEDAVTLLERLLDIDPNHAPALNYLGYMWAEQGQNLERALQLVQQAVALEPDNGAYIDSLGWAHFQLGQYVEAQGYLERAARLVGDDATVFEHLGDLYTVLGREAEAREFYRRSLALADENAPQVQQKLDRLGGGQ